MQSSPKKISPSNSGGTQSHQISSVDRAQRVVDAVVGAWHGCDSSGRLDIPMSVIATLAAIPHDPANPTRGTALADLWTPQEFVQWSRLIWGRVIRHRPDTIRLLYPILRWFLDTDIESIDADLAGRAYTVARAALGAGQIELTGTERRLDVDLLGMVLTPLRPASAHSKRGQFYTSPEIAGLMTELLGVETGHIVRDDTMGTGGLFRAAAARMRAQGRNPHHTRWAGCDIDETAVACATVNAMIWDLGDDLVFHTCDPLTEPDWHEHALHNRNELRCIAADAHHWRSAYALLLDL